MKPCCVATGVVDHIELSILVGGGSGQQIDAVRMKSKGMQVSEGTIDMETGGN